MAMRALRVVFGGAGAVSVDWASEVEGRAASVQRAAVLTLTHLGSDQIIPGRGTEVAKQLLSAGAFSFTHMQHVLNFGALKVRKDSQLYAAGDRSSQDTITAVKLRLASAVNSEANVRIEVTTADGAGTSADFSIESE
jgi:hypothetical protein